MTYYMAIDPGNQKSGVACLSYKGELVDKRILPTSELVAYIENVVASTSLPRNREQFDIGSTTDLVDGNDSCQRGCACHLNRWTILQPGSSGYDM